MRHIYVEPGSLAVMGNEEGVLESFLGSCVGVALYDQGARVGGLIHVLLPEGAEKNEKESPATFASSGIPLLIEKMEERGGRKERMVAHLAGGASILSNEGFSSLNIGRRNVMTAKQILEAANIPILTESVGGRTGRGIKLHLTEGKVGVRLSLSVLRDEKGEDPIVSDLRPLLQQAVDALRPDSKVAIRALQLIGCDSVDFKELEGLILRDQVLAANVLRIANSAKYGLPRQISRVSQAISLLGLKTFRRIVMQACVKNLFSSPFRGYEMDEGEFFHHAVACAEVAGYIGGMVDGVEPEEAYLAGLLHDIGKIALERSFPEFFTIVKRRVIENRETFVDAERKVFGEDHAGVGRMVAVKWNLPKVLETAIGFHHDPAMADGDGKLVSIIHIANYICNMVGVGLCSDTMANMVRSEALITLKFDSSQVLNIVSYIPKVVSRYG